MTAFNGRPERVVLPRAAEVAGRHPFPVLASLAPVVGAVVIWAVTSSPFALVFAVLGPVIAVASLGDSRMQARRQRSREAERGAGSIEWIRADPKRFSRVGLVAPRG